METTRAGIAIYKINYQSDFILTVVCDVEWGTPFCIKFWTGEPAQAYYVGWDGKEYRNCKVVESDPSKLLVLFDDHHLPVGELKMQIAYHTTIEDFPNAIVDEVTNSMKVMAYIDGKNQKIALDFEGEEDAELQFELPAYANEAQRIANEEQRIANEQARIEAEQQRIDNEQTRQNNEAQRIAQESARVNEYAGLKADAVAATDAANDAATLANQKAQLAADKAALADAAATLANQKAQLAADKAALADAAATLANQKAEYADAQGDYAKEQGDYAKEQGDYAKEQGDTALADHRRAESDHETAASDHTIAENDHTQAGNDHTRAESDHSTAADDHTLAASDHSTAAADHTLAASDHSTAADDHTLAASDHSTAANDHTQAGNDHTRAESDHTRAESDHAAVEVYVDSLGSFDISSYHATGGVLAKYADLTAALGTNGVNIPEAIRKGGMSVKFVHSSDNKYVQYRLTTTTFSTNVSDWQGVDDTPTIGSENLVTSGGVKDNIDKFYGIEFNWVPGYYNSSKVKTSATGWECMSIDLSNINSLDVLNVLANGNATYCFLIKNDGTTKQSWNNETVNVENLDVSDCKQLLLSNRTSNTGKAINILSVTSVLELDKQLETSIDDISIRCFNNTFILNAAQGVWLQQTIDIPIKNGETFCLYLPQTDKIDSNGVQAFFNYSDNTQSSPQFLPPDTLKTYTLTKDVVGIYFSKGEAGIIGTGEVPVKIYLENSLQNQISGIRGAKTEYVSTTGNDSNDGLTLATAKATVNAALEDGASNVLIEGGVYFMNINLDKSSQSNIVIKGISGNNPVVIKSPNSVFYNSGEEEEVSGYANVNKITTNLSSIDDAVRFYFDGMNDVSTLISRSEIHPCQHGKTYRCDCTRVVHTTANTLADALAEINTSDEYKWYFDNGNLYFKKPTSPTNVYPLIMLSTAATHLQYTKKIYNLSISNIEFRYAIVNVDELVNVDITSCSSKFICYNGNCFSYSRAINVRFKDCEAAGAYASDYGDGFNGGVGRNGYVEIINCWSHDNHDDGFSDHDSFHTLLIGGLFEYNGKAGVTPARGSFCECHDVFSRKNYCGFHYILGASSANMGSMMLYNCISDSNNRGSNNGGFRVTNGRTAILYNCIAMNESVGYFCSSGSKMTLVDCKSVNCNQVKSGSSNDLTIVNGATVE